MHCVLCNGTSTSVPRPLRPASTSVVRGRQSAARSAGLVYLDVWEGVDEPPPGRGRAAGRSAVLWQDHHRVRTGHERRKVGETEAKIARGRDRVAERQEE